MHELSIFDQVPSLGAYTVISLIWPLDEALREQTVLALEEASLTLTKSFPFLAGQVITERAKGTENVSSGTYGIIDYEPHDGKPPLRIKDCTSLCPPYGELRQRKAPISMLDGSVLSAMKGLPYYYDGSEARPVFVLQANFIKDGLILTSACMHNALDMNGQGQVLRLFAQALRGEEFSEAQIYNGNVDRRQVIPLLEPDQKPLAHDRLRCPSSLSNPAFGGSPHSAPWKLFHFPGQTLVKLKDEASQCYSSDKDASWISTNDALTAFVWQKILAARSVRLGREVESTLVRAINARGRLDPPIPQGYMGHCVACSFLTARLQEVVDQPLPATARKIRQSLREIDDYHIRSMATTLASLEDKTTFSYGAQFKPDTDLMVSSWAELGLYQQVFGPVLGKPAFIRRPLLTELESLVYLMPRTDDGGITVAMSIREEDAKALVEDSEWMSCAEPID